MSTQSTRAITRQSAIDRDFEDILKNEVQEGLFNGN